MKNKRLICRLDIKNHAVVKGVNMEGLRVIGAPEVLANYYYKQGIDELVYMDVVASLYDRNGLENLILATSNNLFIPLCVGGGIRNIEDVDRILSAGADKITVNTGAVQDVKLINKIASKYGSSTVVSAIETLKVDDDYYAFTDSGREYTGIRVSEWITQVQQEGAGEILLSSISRDGTGEGFDLDLLDRIASFVNVPLIVHGGAGKVKHIKEILEIDVVDGACISSVLHYHPDILNLGQSVDVDGNTSFAKSGLPNKLIETVSLKELKIELNRQGHSLR